MLKTLERYQRYIYASADAAVPSSDEMQNNYQEYVKLKTRVEVLQHSQRNLLGEDLDPLSTSELDQLESQVDKTLKQIRSRKTQVLLDELCDLKRKEQMLQDANRTLKRKVNEADAVATPRPQLPWQSGCGNGDRDGILSDEPPQPEHFFQALEGNPSLQPAFHTMDMNQQPMPAPGGCYPPAWMA
uniref:M31 n=1 Tax=Arundo donax TaxID=35708 RepID=A0A0A9A330_ARUDO